MLKIFIFLLVLFPVSLFSQKVKNIKLDYKYCKDAYIWYLTDQSLRYGKTNDLNYENREYISAVVWTWDGSLGFENSLLYFDISSIPSNTQIVNAKLSLHKYDDFDKKDFDHSESYEFYVQKILSVWDENKVTWNNQPKVSDKDKFIVPDKGDYTNIDLTNFVKDWVKNPSENFGIMISCTIKETYRGIVFCSKEYQDNDLRPSLTITYKVKDNKTAKFNNSKRKEELNN